MARYTGSRPNAVRLATPSRTAHELPRRLLSFAANASSSPRCDSGQPTFASSDDEPVVPPPAEGAFRLNLKSGRQTALLRRPPLIGTAWSADSRLLSLNGPVILDAKTKRLRRAVTSDDCFDPAWSPDGRWLACDVGYGEEDEKRRGGYDLVPVNPMTGARVTLTDSATARQANWRPGTSGADRVK